MYKIEETLPSPGIEAFIKNPVIREMVRNEIKSFNKQSPSNALVNSATYVGGENYSSRSDNKSDISSRSDNKSDISSRSDNKSDISSRSDNKSDGAVVKKDGVEKKIEKDGDTFSTLYANGNILNKEMSVI